MVALGVSLPCCFNLNKEERRHCICINQFYQEIYRGKLSSKKLRAKTRQGKPIKAGYECIEKRFPPISNSILHCTCSSSDFVCSYCIISFTKLKWGTEFGFAPITEDLRMRYMPDIFETYYNTWRNELRGVNL